MKEMVKMQQMIFSNSAASFRMGVVQCLTRDRGDVGSAASPASLRCVLEQDTLILA